MKVYAGIGSRSTPESILAVMTALARALRHEGWLLRSGNAAGADSAFQAGAGTDAEVYVPSATFGEPFEPGSVGIMPSPEAFALAEEYHPAWDRCSPFARALHARNGHQVLGQDLATPARFVVCWTHDGSLDGTGGNTGGTGQALRIAAANDIEVVNLRRPDHLQRVTSYLAKWAVNA